MKYDILQSRSGDYMGPLMVKVLTMTKGIFMMFYQQAKHQEWQMFVVKLNKYQSFSPTWSLIENVISITQCLKV